MPTTKPRPHDLILFDLDGTLSDPLVGIGRSINYALTHYGYPARELGQLSACVGPPLDESFKALTGVTTPSHIDALVAKYRERYAEVGYSENEQAAFTARMNTEARKRLSTYFGLLKNNYPTTQYTREVIEECSTYRNFIGQ